ncbi:hypothetical protein [Methanobrevibacter sp.]|uniref:hypothetical protein n=1 Tax=Methanobrevibacter sp. TaxID=66852 RepID=UPI003862D4F8
MLETIQKIAISKTFLISLALIFLMFTAVGLNIDQAYALDLNETDDVSVEVDLEDMMENSQENEIRLSNTQENEILQANSYSLNGGTFSDIQRVIDNADSGDTIKLSGTFVPASADDTITLNKKLTFTSSSKATLNGKKSTAILKITSGGAQSSFSNLKFINGYTDARGAAVRVSAKFITFDNCVFENNFANVTSGAIHTPYKAETAQGLTLKNCNFTKNGAGIAAGAVGAFSHDFKIINCIFDSNYIRGPDALCGGAIQIGLDTEPSYGVVRDCLFKNNIVVTSDGSGHAGAGCVRNGSSYYNCVFINNTADHGGALTYHASGNLNNCTLINNTANVFGGAVSILMDYQDYMDLNITNSVFKGNKAPLGGAVKLDGFNIKIEKSTFDDNYASEYGGAVNIEANNVKIIKSEFNRNIANIDGGAVFIKGNDTTVKNSKFIANEAIPDVKKLNDGLGGAIYVNSTKVLAQNNIFKYNTARNGSAIYFDKHGVEFKLKNNTLYQNQAWVYHLPVSAQDIYYGEVERVSSVIYGGNNIADYDNLAVSNAIYNAANYNKIEIDGEHPVSGATMSGKLYQDDREYNMKILMTVKHEDGTVVYNKTLKSNYLGEVSANLTNLKPGKYYVTAKHFEDNYYKAITNTTVFNVYPKIDNRITKSSNKDSVNYGDLIVWTLSIANNGPNNATGVVVNDLLPDGLIWKSDDSNGKFNPKTGVLKIESLNVGKTFVVNIVTLVNKTGDIVNKANVTGIEFDTNLNNNHDEKSITVPQAADVAVVKKVNVTAPNYGDLVKWTLTVKNNGPDVAHSVKVADVLPGSLIFVSSDGNYNNKTGVWTVGTLGVGKSVKLNIVARVNGTGVIKNNATVSLKEFDYDLSNNFDEAQVGVTSAVDVSVVKKVNVTAPNYGDLVKWTLTVKNNGPDVAHDVKVVDVLPSSLKFISCDLSAYNNKTGVWTVGTLGVGKSVKLNIVCKVDVTGKIVNNVNVTSREFDYDLTNNKDQKAVNVNPAVDVGVVKSANVTSLNYHDLVKWTIKVSNNGPDVAHDVRVVDVLPNSLKFISCDQSAYNNRTGVWTVGTLGVGKSVKLNIVAKADSTGKITNKVNVSSSEFDYDFTNNNDQKAVNVNPACDLEVQKLVNNSNPNYADSIKWIIKVLNNGPNVAHDVKVVDILPKSLIFVSCNGNYNKSNGIWNIGTLNPLASVQISIICKVNATGKITNKVNVTSREFDYDLTNNYDDEQINVKPSADLEITKSVNASTANYTSLVKWTLTIKNNGPNKATGVKVVDILPKGFVYINSTLDKGSYSNNVFNIGNLDVGETLKITIITQANKTGKFVNSANITGNEYDYNLTNNVANKSITINPASDMEVLKLVNNSNHNFRDLVKWTLTVKNNGPDDAHDVKVIDFLPESLIWVSDDSHNKYNHNAGVWNIGTLNKGKSIELNIISRVNATGNITNNAKVSAKEFDYNLKNNKDGKSIVVNNSGDLTIIKTVNDSEVNYGDLVKWTLIASNKGPDKVTGIVVEDALPNGLILLNYTASKGFYDEGIWNVCCLEKDETERLEIICKVNETGHLTNIAKISGNEYDPDLTNNVDNESIDVPSAADIAVLKEVNDDNLFFGDVITWRITVMNIGPDNATDVRVYDELPKELIFNGYVSSRGTYENGVWSLDYLIKGGVEYLNISCYVNGLGTITNNISAIANEYDINMSNNYDNESIDAFPVSDLSIEKSANVSNANYGDIVKWTLIVSNEGLNDATGVIVEDLLPDGLKFISAEGYGIYEAGIWYIGELEVGDFKKLEITSKVVETGDITNFAIVSGNEEDPNPENNEAEDMIHVYPAADLAITKTVSKYQYKVGDLVAYSIKLTNAGPDDALNVKVREIFDKSLILKSVKATRGIFDTSTYEWSIDELAAGGEEKLLLKFEAIKDGVFRNIVNVVSDTFDIDLSNNEDFALVKIVKNPSNNFTDKLTKHKLSKAMNIKHPTPSLGKYSTANLIALLIVSALVSIIFGSGDIFKKR